MRLDRPPPGDQVTDHQHDDRADGRGHDAHDVEPADGGPTEPGEEEAADERADHDQDQVEEQISAGAVDEIGGQNACDEAQKDPGDDRQFAILRCEDGPLASRAPEDSHRDGRRLVASLGTPRDNAPGGPTPTRAAVEARQTVFKLLRRAAAPTKPKPKIRSAHVEGSGTETLTLSKLAITP